MRQGVLLFGRTRVAPSTAIGLAVALVVSTLLQGRTFVAPVIPWDVTVLTSPLLPVVVAVVALRACEPVLHDLEVTVPQSRVVAVRLAWGLVLVAGLAGLSAVTAMVGNVLHPGVTVPPATLALGFLSFFSLGLLGSILLGSDLGWVPPCLVAVALVFFGRDPDQAAYGWAWVLHPAASASSWLVPVGLMVLALACYAWADTVGSLRSFTGGRS